MKNKRFLVKTLVVSFVVMMAMILKPTKVNATFDSSDVNTRLILKTTINNYSNLGDLCYEVNVPSSGTLAFTAQNGDGSVDVNYTKTIYLSSDSTFSETSSNNKELDESSEFTMTDSTFDNGETVYLYEVYDFAISNGLAINADAFTATFSDGDYLYLDISNTYVRNNAMSEYSYNATNKCRPTMYLEGIYDNGVIASRDGNFYNSICYSDGDSKTTVLDKGTINMPRFFWRFNGTASGNLLPSGKFYVGSNEATANNDGTWYETRYSDFVSFANSTIRYEGTDNNYIDEDGEHTYTETQAGASIDDNSSLESYLDNGDYKVSRSMTVTLNKDNPTGVFFDVMPFMVAIVIAGVGVVLLKKNSVK